MMNFFDSHAHLTDPELLPHVEALIKRAKLAGVSQVINVCTDTASLEAGLQLETRDPWIRNAGATTPHDVEKCGVQAFPLFAQAAREHRLVAIGETGLDYHYQHSQPSIQQEFLIRYIELAIECELPVIFHCREAFRDLFSIADHHYLVGAPAVVHCFTGTMEEAKNCIERGWMISFSGIVTFKNSESLRDVARWVPLESMLIETDAPYLAPQSKRGQVNEPANIYETASCLATLKNRPIEEIAEITMENARRIFSESLGNSIP